ncbi:MAG: gamma-glutamyltranspeptidase / glutathione hydrolase [Thermoleophilaceae bacterium]|nr:gamma-glutamyltranspeptidase / glutathione hydrolase [Thermoleophilaceae bacterium]
MKGVIAAGHPLSAEAGARVLREGGNAVDAAVAAVLMSWVCEPLLTGPGAGGFMLVHTPAGENALLDFFVAAPGKGSEREGGDLKAFEVAFTDEASQMFHAGPASCGVYGTPVGICQGLERFGSLPLADLTAWPAQVAREGHELNEIQGYVCRILSPILLSTEEGRSTFAPGGDLVKAGETLRFPEVGDLLERLGSDGPGFLYDGDVAGAISDWVLERGGLITRQDLADYGVIDREPAEASYHGREILTNPPPSSGGILIAYSLDLLERIGRPGDLRALVEVMDQTNKARTGDFATALHTEGYLERFLAKDAVESVAGQLHSRLGSTTHISVMDAAGGCVSVTCSNGSCSGVIVPGTGIHLNNMLGEEDLNPLGHHRHERGARVPSMMAPTVVLHEGGVPEIALGSAGSNRIRSAILQTILNIVDFNLEAAKAVELPRLHLEHDVVEAEPGVDPRALESLERAGWTVQRWHERNLYFGGVQAVARDTETGELSGGGDPRRGGAAVVVD